ncbi:MAG: N-acetylmuramoyl-L-alanine amidase [Peptostreptococcaceae bacterium]
MSLIRQDLISNSKYSIKCPYDMQPIGICIHNTYNDAPAKNEISYMKSNNNQVSYHIAIDDKEAIQAIPFNRNAWASGDGNGQGNRKHIHIEICYSKSGGTKFLDAEILASKVVAELLKKYNWGIDKIKAHRDFAKKDCPHRTNMNNLKKLVEKELKAEVVDMNKIVLYFGDTDLFAATIVSQKFKCPLMKKSDFDASGLKAKEIVQIGGKKEDTDRFTTMKNACKYL